MMVCYWCTCSVGYSRTPSLQSGMCDRVYTFPLNGCQTLQLLLHCVGYLRNSQITIAPFILHRNSTDIHLQARLLMVVEEVKRVQRLQYCFHVFGGTKMITGILGATMKKSFTDPLFCELAPVALVILKLLPTLSTEYLLGSKSCLYMCAYVNQYVDVPIACHRY